MLHACLTCKREIEKLIWHEYWARENDTHRQEGARQELAASNN